LPKHHHQLLILFTIVAIHNNHAFDEYSNPLQRTHGLGWRFSSTAGALFKSNAHLNGSPHDRRDSALGWYTYFNPVIELVNLLQDY
jgi:hypothetical protein